MQRGKTHTKICPNCNNIIKFRKKDLQVENSTFKGISSFRKVFDNSTKETKKFEIANMYPIVKHSITCPFCNIKVLIKREVIWKEGEENIKLLCN